MNWVGFGKGVVVVLVLAIALSLVIHLIGANYIDLVGILLAGFTGGWMLKDVKNGALAGLVGVALTGVVASILIDGYLSGAIPVDSVLIAEYITGVGGLLALAPVVAIVIDAVFGLIGGMAGGYFANDKRAK